MMIVTGANGQLGRAIVEQLLARVPAQGIGVSVREPASAAALAARGVRVRQGDFADPHSLRHAFEGASQVLLVSSNARATGGDTLAQHQCAIDAARAAGVQRVVYTSQMAASASSAFPPARDHAATEQMLAQSGLAWTALRHGFYASSGIGLLGDVANSGVVEAPADGKVAWTAHADLAEAAAIILVNEARYEGPTPPLTASHSLDLADLTAIATELLGKEVVRRTLSDEQLRANMAARGVPERIVGLALSLYQASRDGEFARTDATLAQLLGRPPVSMRAVMAQALGKDAATAA